MLIVVPSQDPTAKASPPVRVVHVVVRVQLDGLLECKHANNQSSTTFRIQQYSSNDAHLAVVLDGLVEVLHIELLIAQTATRSYNSHRNKHTR